MVLRFAALAAAGALQKPPSSIITFDIVEFAFSLFWDNLSQNRCIKNTLSSCYLCYRNCAKHLYDIYAVKIYLLPQICLCGRFHIALGLLNSTVLLILLWIWNFLRDSNSVLLLYRIRFSRRPRLSSLGISGNKLADKSSLQDQGKQQKSFFVIIFLVKYYDLPVAIVR